MSETYRFSYQQTDKITNIIFRPSREGDREWAELGNLNF